VLDCEDNLVETCSGTDGCDPVSPSCTNACQAAEGAKRSIGCEYYAVQMDQLTANACFTAFVANTWNGPAHLTVQRAGVTLPIDEFAYHPVGFGPALTYAPYDPGVGLAPGEVAILFLAGEQGAPEDGPVCPVATAVPEGTAVTGTGRADAFRITSNVPVVAYQMSPYGGGSAAITGASLLIPTSAWDLNYVAIHGYDSGPHPTSLNIIAKEDDTTVRMLPVANIAGGGGLPPGSALDEYTVTLAAGQYLQLTQPTELTGSPVEADKPIGFLAGARCSFVPAEVDACDHLEQMIPPVQALGSEYVGVSHATRSGEPSLWRLVGVVDGTELTWSNDIGGPATLELGEEVEVSTQFPFVVHSQDDDHPFILVAHMRGGSTNGMDGVGDADAVISVPPAQYLSEYVFFTDPTYPITQLVVVRAKKNGSFEDVSLDCGGVLGGWENVGNYQYVRVDLTDGDFEPVGSCSTGSHTIESEAPFGLWVWGWGGPQTSSETRYVSYGYPGGMSVDRINDVEVPTR
jgi:hypothetical protein